jgi:hypothetical protein
MTSPNERFRGSIGDVPVHIRQEADLGWPSTDEVRDRLQNRIWDAMANGQYGIIEAVTSSGKTHNGAATRWTQTPVTGGEPVIHLHETTDARSDAVKKSIDADVDYRVLQGREEACDVAAGDYDDSVDTPDGSPASEWIDRQCGSASGTTFSAAHSHLEEHNDGDLPCAPCESQTQYEGIPRNDDDDPTVDVIHATHQFAFVPNLIHETNVFLDEQPDFSIDVDPDGSLTQQRIQDMVVAWLKKIDADSPTTWEAFVVRARDGLDPLEETITDTPGVNPEWFIEKANAHTLAPALTRAIYDALSQAPDANGRHCGSAHHDLTRFEAGNVDDSRYTRTRVTIVIDQDNRVQKIWNVPEMGNARSIICLDAWPAIPEFEQNVGTNLDVIELMNQRERNQARRFERGLEVVQIGDAARPAGSEYAAKNYFKAEQVRVVIEWLRTLFGDEFRSVIAPSKVEAHVQKIMRDVGIENPEDCTMHQGEEKSREDFSDESVGFVTNCLDAGDDYVLDLLAARGLNATPETKVCEICDGQGCRECKDEGKHRLPGRGFEGPDADKANEILEAVRANHTNQCVGRYARRLDNPANAAVVFVRTNTVDDSLVDKKIPDPWVFGEKQQAAIDYLRENPDTTLKETVKATENQFDNGITKQSVKDTFVKLIEYGVAKRSEGTGAYGADEYQLTSPVPEHGLVRYPELNSRKSPNDS